jgi:hypothetical protein
MVIISADVHAEFIAIEIIRNGGQDAGAAGSIGEDSGMRVMKTALAIAAVGAATVSLTMVARRNRQGDAEISTKGDGKGRRSRA